MSKKPSQQKAAAVRNAKLDKAAAERMKQTGKQDPISQATYDRNIAKQNAIIEKNS